MSRSTAQRHSYGTNCRLAPIIPLAIDNDVPPPIRAQFFYSSAVPIDDPFASGSLAGANEARISRGSFRPFSRGDNNDLERAWRSLRSDHHRRIHNNVRQNRSPTPNLVKDNNERLNGLVGYIATRHYEKHGVSAALQEAVPGAPSDLALPTEGAASPIPVCCSELCNDVEAEMRQSFCALSRKHEYRLSSDSVVQEMMMEFRRRYMTASKVSRGSRRPKSGSVGATTGGENAGITGKPFIRVGSPEIADVSVGRPPSSDSQNGSKARVLSGPVPSGGAGGDDNSNSIDKDSAGNEERKPAPLDTSWRPETAEVAVGVSRLHLVSLPALQMKPIYWSPVNDVSIAMRATWFYRDTMMPVPPAVANQLEAGYKDLRPWTETWNDELRCAVEVGPPGEEKVSHRLWPEESPKSRKETSIPQEAEVPADPYCAARCCNGEAATEGALEDRVGDRSSNGDAAEPRPPRSFSSYHVIYRDRDSAFLLKPSLKPSAYYGRRPVAKIMKGLTVGIPVVRGFDPAVWERLYDKRKERESRDRNVQVPTVEDEALASSDDECPACATEKENSQVTDLVLVIHGIGQKFAEKVESYHFTHAVNSFRRAVNMELRNPMVGPALRKGQNGIMVLPVNWRHNLSFEAGGPMTEADKKAFAPDGFSLKDIEPPTIPAVRSIISDVMFDIPFYMSHYKPMMIHALTQEANRVYRLWCRNNVGFEENGRVHLIGHSLGSAMAIDILSRQPSWVPRPLPSRTKEQDRVQEHFDFDTANLFLLGSPAGFFLLLERGILLPRRGRLKPGADPADTVAAKVVGEAGTYGCIAVDNIYNILAKEDPVAYLLNGTIDAGYAASLKPAYVPSTSASFLQAFGNAMRGFVPGVASPPSVTATTDRPKPALERLPSQLELEVHDFTREEIAEKKAYLLNDNGQIDYYLHSAGGALEIQYLNMLSAHSCYWTHRDFIRLLCLEVGRDLGRAHTLPAMRAVKAKKPRLHVTSSTG